MLCRLPSVWWGGRVLVVHDGSQLLQRPPLHHHHCLKAFWESGEGFLFYFFWRTLLFRLHWPRPPAKVSGAEPAGSVISGSQRQEATGPRFWSRGGRKKRDVSLYLFCSVPLCCFSSPPVFLLLLLLSPSSLARRRCRLSALPRLFALFYKKKGIFSWICIFLFIYLAEQTTTNVFHVN